MNFNTEDLVIIADHREEQSGIPTILAYDALFDVRKAQLSCGDYLVFDLVIERKTARDFLDSLHDGRLFKQLFYMKRLYRRTTINYGP